MTSENVGSTNFLHFIVGGKKRLDLVKLLIGSKYIVDGVRFIAKGIGFTVLTMNPHAYWWWMDSRIIRVPYRKNENVKVYLFEITLQATTKTVGAIIERERECVIF